MELLETSANPFHLYRQAKRIARSTSRATNPDWYRRTSELQIQWHLWVGQGQVVSAVHNRATGEWHEGPPLPPVHFALDDAGNPGELEDTSRNALHESIRTFLVTKAFGKKPKSLGIVFHLADEIRVRDLSPDFAADTDFDTLNELLLSAPDIALGDDSVSADEGKWRLVPLLGIVESDKKSVAVQLSANYEKVVGAFREYAEMRNLPVVVEVKAAPLEAMAGLPALLPEVSDLCNTLSILQFDAFTMLCATGKRGELLMIRPLIHRSGEFLSPSELSEFLTNTAALLNLKTPRIVSASFSRVGVEFLREQLLVYGENHQDAEVHLVDAKRSEHSAAIPGQRFEFAVDFLPASPAGQPVWPLEQLRGKWAAQDFYALPAEEVAKMPTRGDLQLLRFAALGTKAALVAVLVIGGWIGADFFTKMRSEAWRTSPTAAYEMQERLVRLQRERREWQHWDNLLKKRSEGWLALEALSELFPEEGGVVLSRASYRAQTSDEDSERKTIGVNREWSITGYANPEVASQLPTLGSRNRAAELLDKIAETSRADYLSSTGDHRNVTVSLQQRQGAMPPSAAFPARVARHYRTAFDLRITQSFSGKDELAITTRPLKHE